MENQKPLIIALSVLAVVVVLGGLGLYAVQIKQSNDLRQEVSSAIGQLSAQITELKTQPTTTDVVSPVDSSNSAEPAAGELEIATTGTSRVSIDQNWDLYTNNTLGFSIKIPKKTMWKTGSYDNVEALESGNIVYITFKKSYYYQTILNNISGTKTELQKVTGVPWGILVKTVNNDKELETFIKSKYGSGCSLGAKTISGEPNTYNVAINGDGLGLDKTKCEFGYIRFVKYSPTGKKAALWDGGQDINFQLSPNIEADTIMSGSFRFIK